MVVVTGAAAVAGGDSGGDGGASAAGGGNCGDGGASAGDGGSGGDGGASAAGGGNGERVKSQNFFIIIILIPVVNCSVDANNKNTDSIYFRCS